ALCDACWTASGTLCIICGKTPARTDRIYMHCCKTCFAGQSPAMLAKLVQVESESYVESLPPAQSWTGKEPAFQLFLHKTHSQEALPAYSATPDYVHPDHCRLCLAHVRPEDIPAHLMEMHRDVLDAECEVLDSYRNVVLQRSLTEWPTPISPQIVRARLAAFKAELTDANFAMAPCAVCARDKRRCKLQTTYLPDPSDDACPDWLQWPADVWTAHKDAWHTQLDNVFNVDRYMELIFCKSERLREAELNVAALLKGEESSLGFTTPEAARSWQERVQRWAAVVRTDLAADSTAAPGHPDRLWLLYRPGISRSSADCQGAASGITANMCKHCASALRELTGPREDRRPRVRVPPAALANGMWRGADPREFVDLTYAECKVINLAKVYVSIKRVFLSKASYAPTATSEAPTHHQKNVVAYPQSPETALTAIGMLPAALAQTMVIQFVGGTFDDLHRHPDLQVSVFRLRAAFRWLSLNNWMFMFATRHHEIWRSGTLHAALEALLSAYASSIGSSSGVPREVLSAATAASAAKASVASEGPADCTDSGAREPDPTGTAEDGNAAVVNGGMDDVPALRLWTRVVENFDIASRLQDEIHKLSEDHDSSARAQKKMRHNEALAKAVEAMQRMSHDSVRKELDKWAAQEKDDAAAVQITHGDQFLSSRAENFWAACFVRLFPRGDYQETCSQRPARLPAATWAKTLLTRADTVCWRRDVEFVATLFNTFLRRDQMASVEAHVKSTASDGITGMTSAQTTALAQLTAEGLVSSAAAAGDAANLRDLLRQQGLDPVVRNAAHRMHLVLRRVRGSAEEREGFIWRFRALRIWSGCASLFFTLNPHDIRSPLTVLLAQDDATLSRKFSLDMTDDEATQWMADFNREDPRRLHRAVAKDPPIATRVFHWTVRLVMRALFNCADAPDQLNCDGIAAKNLPGIVGHVRAHLGVVEEQMRKALHIHMLIQLVGFSHPDDLFQGDHLQNAFRLAWHYVASITFRSTEAFAHYAKDPLGQAALQQLPLLPLTKSQREKIGGVRTAASNAAQWQGRGLQGPAACAGDVAEFPFFPTSFSSDRNVDSGKWAVKAVQEIFSRTRKTGNHVCRPAVCYKGRLGKKGFCRMHYWHWACQTDAKTGKDIAKRQHGLELHARWDGTGELPILRYPPHVGLPALETTHPFHFRLNPAIMLGPQCNHDLAVLLRFCELPANDADLPNESRVAQVKAAMAEAMGDHEYSASAYSAKSQPHADGLKMTLAASLERKERAAQLAAATDMVDDQEKARKLLHTQVAATNNRMHKGFPEMISYLLGKPIAYSSHTFVPVFFGKLLAIIRATMSQTARGEPVQTDHSQPRPYTTKLTPAKLHIGELDYVRRPQELEQFPFYFFFASCDAKLPVGKNPPPESLRWVRDGSRRQCTAAPVTSATYDGVPLRGASTDAEPNGEVLYRYAYYISLRLTKPWKVPILYGKLPGRPASDDHLDEWFLYALNVMVLFRSFRALSDFVTRITSTPWPHGEKACQAAVVHDFRAWEMSTREVARKCTAETPPLTPEWWAHRILESIRNYDFASSRRQAISEAVPSSVQMPFLPPWNAARDEAAQAAANDPDTLLESDDDGDDDANPPDIPLDDDNTGNDAPARRHRAPDPASLLCGIFPAGVEMDDVIAPAAWLRSTAAEAKYIVEFMRENSARLRAPDVASRAPVFEDAVRLRPAASLAAADRQADFFKMIDAWKAETSTKPQKSTQETQDALQHRLQTVMADGRSSAFPLVPPRTRTAVLDACFHLLRAGVLNVVDMPEINVKQARALLWNAAWLQDVMNRARGFDEPSGPTVTGRPSLADGFQIALMGPGGTGKTAVLRVVEAIICYFNGPDTVQKCAPSNSAARLLRGDTLHALCKLPFGNVTVSSKKGRLTRTVLESHRSRWEGALACFIDEVSMVAAAQLFQAEVRLKAAKNSTQAWGGLGMTLSGDFMQLPPVDPTGDNRSLATDLDEVDVLNEKGEYDQEHNADKKRSKHVETVQGLQLWRRVRKVVTLEVNVRAPGTLSQLLAEMRAGNISDAMWSLYTSRILSSDDARPRDPASPFSTNPWTYIVHRHKIRVYRSMQNAKQQALRTGHRLIPFFSFYSNTL
ncbi:unnamed protein product, partial [Prorocentrum cordatum]